jgi:hypothetical protein
MSVAMILWIAGLTSLAASAVILFAWACRVNPFLRSISEGWDRFWFSPADPATLSLIRVLFGTLLFYVHLTYSWDLLAYVGKDAWCDQEAADFARLEITVWRSPLSWNDPYEFYAKGNYFWSAFFHVTDPASIVCLHVAFLTAMLLFAVGLWTPYAAFISWIGAMSYVQRATSTVFGLDSMMLILLTYLQMGPSWARYSLDRWLQVRSARARGEPVPEVLPSIGANFAMRLTQFHFAFIYFASGTSKLLGSTWWSGTALNYVLLNPSFAPMEWEPYYQSVKLLAQSRLAWELFCSGSIVATLALELGLIFLVWDLRWRWVFLCGAAGLHLGIAIIMGLTTFSLCMMIMVLSFVPPAVVLKVLPRIQHSLTWLFVGEGKAGKPSKEMAAAGQ